MHLEKTIVALDDLQAGADPGRLEATSVRRLISIPGAISTHKRAISSKRQKALGNRAEKARVLGLQSCPEKLML